MPTRRALPRLLALALTAFVGVAACSPAPTDPASTVLSADLDDLAAIDGRDLVDTLDALPLDQRPGYIASVRAHEVLLEVDGEQRSVALPDDEFYVSIAPYVNSTHPCTYHSLTTCVGELRGEAIHVVVTDDEGTVLFSGDAHTFDNGFLGLWLPRDIIGTIEITADAGTVRAPISTTADSPTCVTDLQLGA